MTTLNDSMPFWPANSTQPSAAVNQALQWIYALMFLLVEDKDLTAPPTTVAGDVGKCWIVAAGATGAWAGKDDQVAICTGANLWLFLEAQEGWQAKEVGGSRYEFDGSAWVSAGGGTGDVVGPAVSVADRIALFDGTTGKLLKVGSKTIAEVMSHAIGIAVSDETTALAAGTGKVTFRMPYAFSLTGVRASLTTAQASGSIFTVDINEAGASILSTKLTIDNTEKTSTTAVTAAVISDANLADDAEITIDIDQIGDGTAKGLKVWLIGTKA